MTAIQQIRYDTDYGHPHPLGAVPDENGVNFSIFSERATDVVLLLFDEHDSLEPFQVIRLDAKCNKIFHFWHVYVKDLKPGAHYAYRIGGPDDLHGTGDRFNMSKILLDPYSRGNTNTLWNRGAACTIEDNIHQSMRSIVVDTRDYDWEGDKPLNRKMKDTIIYEMHVGGFTKSPTAGVAHPSTYAGIIEKIPYLKELGITAVELLPVMDFDDKEILRLSPIDGTPLVNYWGYSTVGFFAPHNGFCVSPEDGLHIAEFQDMVKALHKAGIEVILDIVFNHTTEGNHEGPVISFKGIDNSTYYHLVPEAKCYYMDYSGCGNTVKANHPIVEKFIVDSLEFWVKEMHVDGFRFDEAVILCRDEMTGRPMIRPPVIWNIELSEALADTKVIAEAWDAAGLYEVGFFPGYRWGEWNGKYRDHIRKFIKGDAGEISGVATVMAGSADIFEASGELPINSINFVACHDGFTLNDLVSYNEKHNEANGEGNRDGIDENLSWNCGVEGPTDDPNIMALRHRQIKNFFATLMLSVGVPMFCAGDEICRTQQGNNNAYCQDNALNWFNWEEVEPNKEMFRFFQKMIAVRKSYGTLRRDRFFSGEANERGIKDITWHGCAMNSPEWNDPECRVLAYTMGGFDGEPDFHVMMNMHWEPQSFDVPPLQGRGWARIVDTALPSPEDIVDAVDASEVVGNYLVTEHSITVLISQAKI